MNERSPSLRRAVSGRSDVDSAAGVRRPWEGRAEQIVQIAADLFRERGYVRTGMSDIADAVGILPGSLYHYISSKEELLYTIIHRAHHQLADEIDKLPLDSMSPNDAMRALVSTHVTELVGNLTVTLVANLDLRELAEEHRTEIVGARVAYRERITGIIARGQADGTWCSQLDPVLAALAVAATANSPTRWYRADNPQFPVAQMADLYSSMAVRMLSCDHDPPCTR